MDCISAENPYIHEDPITETERFIGRDEKVEKIQYYLSQALSGKPNYKNIAITGEEVSGKTSLSYCLESIAEDMGMTSVRVRLNRNSAQDEEEIFKQILESTTAQVDSSMHDDFHNLLIGATEKVTINLRFVQFYLSPESESDTPDEVSEHVVRDDLQNIYQNQDAPAINIILDNAESLAGNAVVLEKLKNIFTEIEGYNLILVGSNSLFDELDSDISSVMRMFERIEVGAFETYKGTREALLQPLDEEERTDIDEQTLVEIHRITGGRPYEINLIGSYMYSNYEMDRQKTLTLNSSVFDNIITKLKEWSDVVDTRVFDAIDQLSKKQIILITSVIEVPGIKYSWLIDYARLRYYNSDEIDNIPSRQSLIESIEELTRSDLIAEDQDQLVFSGNAYAKTYMKYTALSTDLISNFGGATMELEESFISNCHYNIIDELILSNTDDSHSHYILSDHESFDDSLRSVINLSSLDHYSVKGSFEETAPEISESDHVVVGGDPLADRLLMIYPDGTNYEQSQLYPKESDPQQSSDENSWTDSIYIRINIDCLDSGYIALIHTEKQGVSSDIRSEIESIKEELHELGFDLLMRNERTLVEEAISYWEDEEYDNALSKFESAVEINPNEPITWLNMSLLAAHDDEEQALEYVDEALNLNEEITDAYIQRGRILMSLGNEQEGVEQFEQAANLCGSNDTLLTWISGNCGNAGYPDKEVKYAREALEYNPTNYHAKFHEVRGLLSIGESEEAVNIVDELIDTPEIPDSEYIDKAIGFKATALIRLEEHEDAMETLDYLIEERPCDGFRRRAYYNYAEAQRESENYREAIKYLEQALEYNKVPGIDNVEIRVRMLENCIMSEDIEGGTALVEDLQGQVGESEDKASLHDDQSVLEDKSTYPRYLYAAAQLWALKQDGEKSLSYLSRAVSKNNQYAEIAQSDPIFGNIRDSDHSSHIYGNIVNS